MAGFMAAPGHPGIYLQASFRDEDRRPVVLVVAGRGKVIGELEKVRPAEWVACTRVPSGHLSWITTAKTRRAAVAALVTEHRRKKTAP